VRWFIPAASASDYRDLLDMGLLRICTDHHFASQQTSRAWVKHGQPVHHFFCDVFGTVNELFHDKANVQRRVAGLFPTWSFRRKARQSLYRSKPEGFGVELSNLYITKEDLVEVFCNEFKAEILKS
jgi:hypothetical protein